MADNLPTGTIRTNCQVLSVELDPVTKFPHLMLSNGSVLHAKVYFCLFYTNNIVGSSNEIRRFYINVSFVELDLRFTS